MTNPAAIDSDLALSLFFILLLMGVAVRAMWWVVEALPERFGR